MGHSIKPVSHLARCNSVWFHGASLAGDTWDTLTKDLPNAQRPDLPGHGGAPMVEPPRVEAYAQALKENLPPDPVLIGHSLGGMVALELGAQLGKDATALIMIEAVPTVRDRLSSRIAAGIAVALFKRLPASWFASLSGVGECPATRAELQRQFARLDRQHIGAALDAAANYDGRPHLSQIAAPTLAIVGRKNKATHHGAKLMAETIPGAMLLELDGGHMLHTDNPQGLRGAIDDFLRNITRT
ncbi:alpha/beta hydrolase [Cognatiyoonia sp. IB215446]|uniref:alpha/beta fold hydrolase n=1 Tax=Cognatiyoonia sp. IB215446 TaxID=3097355 RepID=UPI002A1652B3|nr:alpha/beta hydrolase [Cognatiyoonia sp. IB215446]MDX8347599.1 alpha/beta hydrolase [Cognatiyoonia sp. IB215446]